MVDQNVTNTDPFDNAKGKDAPTEEWHYGKAKTVNEVRFQTLFETAADGIIVTNDRGRVLMFNKACEQLLGFHANEVVGHNVTMLMLPKHAGTHHQRVSSYLENSKENVIGVAHETSARHKDGSTIPIEITIGEANTPAGPQFIGILRDLRSRQSIQNRLDEMQKHVLQLSRRNTIDEMGVAIAHELNQPLTALTLYLKALEKKGETHQSFSAELDDILLKAVKETERVCLIIERMRSFGKRVPLENVSSDLDQLIQDAIELTVVGYKSRGLTVNTEIEKELPLLRIDPVQVQQILVNLLRNAIDAVEGQDDPWIKVCAKIKGEFVAIKVADSGAGISEKISERLFHTFSSNKKTGMGIGLAISNAIARSHGGYFEVENGGCGQGATFTLFLPINYKGEFS